jgi:aldose 1-epimerase
MNRVLTERHGARTARGTTAIAASPEVASHAGTAPVTSAGCPSVPSIQKVPWGHADGVEVDLYTLCSPSGMVSKISNFGAVLTELEVPDRNGKLDDVVLGWDSFAQYVKYPSFLGATIGRVGNRISNAHFVLDGKTYMLAANNGPHALHGGIKGWHKRVWQAATKETSQGPSLELSLVSKDGDESYPGTVHATTVFTLEKGNTLRIDMTATTDQPTIVNMVNHTYWNLRGGTTGDVKDDLLTLYADRYTPGSPPDGRELSVAGTPFDFRTPKPIGKDLMSTGNTPPGYDENWIVNGPPNTLRLHGRIDQWQRARARTALGALSGIAKVPQFDQRARLAKGRHLAPRTNVQARDACHVRNELNYAIESPIPNKSREEVSRCGRRSSEPCVGLS